MLVYNEVFKTKTWQNLQQSKALTKHEEYPENLLQQVSAVTPKMDSMTTRWTREIFF